MSFVSNEHFNVLVYPDGRYVGIDHDSGGYPFGTTSILSAKLWSKDTKDQNKMTDYNKSFKNENWRVGKVTITSTCD